MAFGSDSLVVYVDQDRSSEADDSGVVEKDPDKSGAALDLLVIRLMGLVDQIFCQCSLGNAAKVNTSAIAVSLSSPVLGEPGSDLVPGLVPRGQRRKPAIARNSRSREWAGPVHHSMRLERHQPIAANDLFPPVFPSMSQATALSRLGFQRHTVESGR